MINNERLPATLLDNLQSGLDKIVRNSPYKQGLLLFAESLMKPFDQHVDLETAFESKLIFGTFCVQVPEELIYAVEGQPVRLDMGIGETADQCDNYLPKLACPMVRSFTGFLKLKTPYLEQIKNIIIPTTCDWKVKLFDQIDPEYNVCTMDLPHQRDTEVSGNRWFSEIVRIKKWIEKISKRKIRKRNLMESIRLVQKAQMEYNRFLLFRREGLVSGSEAILVSKAYFYLHTKQWTQALDLLNHEITENRDSGSVDATGQRTSVLLTGSPVIFPNFKVPLLLEDAGCRIMADELCSSERMFSDIVPIDDTTESGLLRAISDRYLLPCTCPTFSTNKNRLKRLHELVDRNRINGVVYHVLKGCHPYDIESFTIEKAIKERGIPFLKVETDYSNEDEGQLKTRIEAFAEMLKVRQM